MKICVYININVYFVKTVLFSNLDRRQKENIIIKYIGALITVFFLVFVVTDDLPTNFIGRNGDV
jgi:hypothetical protein